MKTVIGSNIFTGHHLLSNFMMTIENGKITHFQDGIDFSKMKIDDTVIDFRESYIIPGLIDSHCHLMIDPLEKKNYSASAESIVKGYNNSIKLLKQGIVACRDLGSANGYVSGIRNAINSGLLGPRIVSAGQALCTTGGHGYQISLACDGNDQLQQGVRQVVHEGADLVKLMASGGVNSPGQEPGPPEFTQVELDIAVSTAHALGRKVSAHTHGYTAIKRCLQAGVDSIEHGVYLEEDLMKIMVDKHIFLIPTFSAPYHAVHEGIHKEPENLDHQESLNVLSRHRKAVLKAYKQGVKVAFGTDVGTPYNIYDQALYELVLMVEAGFTPYQALESATIISGELLGFEDLGKLEVGYEASFIVVDNNPFEDIKHILSKKKIYHKGKLL